MHAEIPFRSHRPNARGLSVCPCFNALAKLFQLIRNCLWLRASFLSAEYGLVGKRIPCRDVNPGGQRSADSFLLLVLEDPLRIYSGTLDEGLDLRLLGYVTLGVHVSIQTRCT